MLLRINIISFVVLGSVLLEECHSSIQRVEELAQKNMSFFAKDLREIIKRGVMKLIPILWLNAYFYYVLA